MTVTDEKAPQTVETILKGMRADKGTRTPEALAVFEELKKETSEVQLEMLFFGALMLSRRLEYYVNIVEKLKL